MESIGYKLMLFAATIIWGAAFVVMKDAVEVLGPAQLVGIRFLLAGLVLALVFRRQLLSVVCIDALPDGDPHQGAVRAEGVRLGALRTRSVRRDALRAGGVRWGGLRAGVIMGIILFSAFWLQTIGLTDTTPGKNAFLTATYCVMVPLIMWAAYRRFPGWPSIVAAVVCLAGIGLVSLQPGAFTMGFGDGITLAGAFVFALEIIFISHFTKTYDAIGITVVQFICCGLLGLAFGLVLEPMPDLGAIDIGFVGELAYLVLLSSCVCYVFQNVGLAHVPPSQGSLILSLESVFGVAFSVLVYGEVLSLRMVIGFALIFVAILVSELAPSRSGKRLENEGGVPGEDQDARNPIED